MSKAEVIQNMVDRAQRCRRLAAGSMDDQATKALREMADQIERDVEELKCSTDGLDTDMI